MAKMKMLPIDYTRVIKEGTAAEKKAIRALAKEIKYNSRLYNFLDMAYDWQKDAIALTKEHRVIGLIAANQVGKSETAMSIVTCHATGIYPDWWQGRKYDRPVKIMIAGVDSNHNKNVLQEKLIGTNNWRLKTERGTGMVPLDYIVPNSHVTVRGDDLTSIKIQHVTGGMSEIMFRAYSMGREAAQGFAADVILIDEQPKDEFWSEALVRTAATNGQVICAFTPLLGMTGLVEELLNLKDIKGGPEDKYGVKYKSQDGWAMVRATWDDIKHISDKDQLKRGFATYESDARIYGIPIAGHGRIMPYQLGEISYDPRVDTVPADIPHLIGIDVGHGHGRDPSAAILVAWDEEKDVVYIREEAIRATDTTRDLVKMIAGLNHTVPVAWPNDAGRSSMNSPASVADQLREYDVNMLPKAFLNPKGADGKRNNYKMPGIHEMNTRFAEGRLRISHDCVELCKQIESYQYTQQGKIQDGKDDAIDAARYAVLSIIQGHGEPMAVTNPRFEKYAEDDFYVQTY